VLSRGYGNCRVVDTATAHVWRVTYFNSQDMIILDTLEVGDVPEVACAARQDLEDSAERLHEVLQWVEQS
jgi:hydrogenase-1 operon protein HyaF